MKRKNAHELHSILLQARDERFAEAITRDEVTFECMMIIEWTIFSDF